LEHEIKKLRERVRAIFEEFSKSSAPTKKATPKKKAKKAAPKKVAPLMINATKKKQNAAKLLGSLTKTSPLALPATSCTQTLRTQRLANRGG
jgi:hypothetical protein